MVAQQQLGAESLTNSNMVGDVGQRRFDLGTLPSHGLGRLLLRIAERRLTGRLVLTEGGSRRNVCFADGYPIFAESPIPEERLGTIALRTGIVDVKTLAGAVRHARATDTKLGRALLDEAAFGGADLFGLLGLQLLTQLTNACLEPERHAFFLADSRAPYDQTVLFMHPMAAVLAAVDALLESERRALMLVAEQMPLRTTEFSAPVSRWLRDLGYGAVPSTLLNFGTPASSLRARLLARGPLISRTAYDARAVPLAAALGTEARPGRRRDPWPDADDLADRIVLALLLAGALEPAAEPDEHPKDTSTATDTDRVSAIRAVLASDDDLADLLPEAEPESEAGVDEAVRLYLSAPRAEDLVARMAVWGAVAEVHHASAGLDDLLTLYLTLKPEDRPERVLALDDDATLESAPVNYARYQTFLDNLRTGEPLPLRDAKLAEVTAQLDWAASKLGVPVAGASDTFPVPGDPCVAAAAPIASSEAADVDEMVSAAVDSPTSERRHSEVVPAGSTAAADAVDARDAPSVPVDSAPELPVGTATPLPGLTASASAADAVVLASASRDSAARPRCHSDVVPVGSTGTGLAATIAGPPPARRRAPSEWRRKLKAKSAVSPQLGCDLEGISTHDDDPHVAGAKFSDGPVDPPPASLVGQGAEPEEQSARHGDTTILPVPAPAAPCHEPAVDPEPAIAIDEPVVEDRATRPATRASDGTCPRGPQDDATQPPGLPPGHVIADAGWASGRSTARTDADNERLPSVPEARRVAPPVGPEAAPKPKPAVAPPAPGRPPPKGAAAGRELALGGVAIAAVLGLAWWALLPSGDGLPTLLTTNPRKATAVTQVTAVRPEPATDGRATAALKATSRVADPGRAPDVPATPAIVPQDDLSSPKPPREVSTLPPEPVAIAADWARMASAPAAVDELSPPVSRTASPRKGAEVDEPSPPVSRTASPRKGAEVDEPSPPVSRNRPPRKRAKVDDVSRSAARTGPPRADSPRTSGDRGHTRGRVRTPVRPDPASPDVVRTQARGSQAPPPVYAPRTKTRLLGFRLQGSPQGVAAARAVARARGAFEACHKQAVRRAGAPRYGRVRVEAIIDSGGYVIRPQVSSAPLPGLDACIAKVVSRIRTPRQPGPSRARASWSIDYAPQ